MARRIRMNDKMMNADCTAIRGTKIYIDTLGCPKNVNDSEVACGLLERAGACFVDDPYEADVLMINTCSFINDAKMESINRIFELAEVKADKLLVVMGCLPKRYYKELFKEMPEVDLFLGVNEFNRLPEILSEFMGKKAEKPDFRAFEVSETQASFADSEVRKLAKSHYSATIKISEGCNNPCTYCVIPKIRGRYVSRPMDDILKEANMLAKNGVRELILIAQDVTVYGIDLYKKYALADLLAELCKIDGFRWIRLLYCYEDRITDELIDVMAREEKICKYFDIPLQHCSDKILKSMKRRSSKAYILETIDKLRTRIPDVHIRTSLITGFPGETKEDFEELLEFVETVKLDRVGVFAYSKEEGTEAALMKPQVRQDVKEKRRDSIMRAQLDISLEKNQEKIGKTMEVLVEGVDEEGAYYGRTRFDAPEIDNGVIFTSDKDLQPGDFVFVEITDAYDYDLVGIAK